MGKLSVFLPPFASDYAGVCSALYDMDCLTVIADAGCCTGHYVYYDEPRWEKSPRPVFSPRLRSVDAIMGNDSKLVERVLEMTRTVPTGMTAVVGTPVPAVTGMDMDGIACEIEAMSDRPCLGFAATGFETYEKGLAMAAKTLVKRFGGPRQETIAGSVNVLGMNPLDYGAVGNDADLKDFLERHGYSVNACLFMGGSPADLPRLGRAEWNLAVSSSGVLMARYLKRKYGTPYLAAAPMGAKAWETVLNGRGEAELHRVVPDAPCAGPVLITGDWVMADSLRRALYLAGCRRIIEVASFFAKVEECAQEGDFFADSEGQWMELIRRRNYTHIIADPLMNRPALVGEAEVIALPHPAVSATLSAGSVPHFLSEEFERFLDNTVNKLNQV